jgi:hypothetical protein
LGIADSSRAVAFLDARERKLLDVAHAGITRSNSRVPMMNFISESGLYKLIFRSRKPMGLKFTDWVTREVIPSIRKTGRYALPGAEDLRLAEEIRLQLNKSYLLLADTGLYPPAKRAVLLAKASAALSGEPLTELLPQLPDGQDRWVSPTGLAGQFSRELGVEVTPKRIGSLLVGLGLHGRQDPGHAHSRVYSNISKDGFHREVISYAYRPEAVTGPLREALRSLFN